MKSISHPKKRLSLYLDQLLTQKETEQLQAHLSHCEQCRSELHRMTALRQMMKLKTSAPVDQDFVVRVLSLHHQRQSENAFWLGFECVPRLLPQLAVVLILILALLWSTPPFSSVSTQQTDDQITRVSLLDEKEMLSDLKTYDQVLRFALNGNHESFEGGKK